ncbi:MAG TPA: ABC transporter ATP-binding protein [Myxococcales bacterium]|nr:ABC transporter ATP-binding protein [Myxococcales bacterium]HET9754478.1 ABC transporter ATP-binding protein [Myxococcales bacterium]
MTALLEVRDLRVSYGHVEAVRGVSFPVEAGSIVALIGPNGAGKSSTLNAIAGLVRPASGSVQLEGRELAGLPSHAAVAAGVVLVPEGRAILHRMSVLENLVMGAEARPWPGGRDEARAAVETQIARFPSLQRRLQAQAGALSGGEQQMLAIARGLLARPRILLLDEPSMGLAPLLVRQIFEIVQEIHRGGTTILLVEQNARMALQTAREAYVLERGEVALHGPAADLARDPRLEAAYLGGDVQA